MFSVRGLCWEETNAKDLQKKSSRVLNTQKKTHFLCLKLDQMICVLTFDNFILNYFKLFFLLLMHIISIRVNFTWPNICSIDSQKKIPDNRNWNSKHYFCIGLWKQRKFLNYCSSPAAKTKWKIQLGTKDTW